MHKVRRYLSPQWTVADLGCGADAGVLRSLRGSIAMGYGLDREVAPHREEGLQCIPCDLSGAVRPPRASVDAVLILAVLEHCPDDAAVVAEAAAPSNFEASTSNPCPMESPTVKVAINVTRLLMTAICPDFCFSMNGNTAFVIATLPIKFTSMIFSYTSRLVSFANARWVIPALLNNTSILPNFSNTGFTFASTVL